jgi:hypothetical protein
MPRLWSIISRKDSRKIFRPAGFRNMGCRAGACPGQCRPLGRPYIPIGTLLRRWSGNDRIPSGMKLRALPFLWCSLALFIGGCPKRQAPTRIVYVPSPPPPAVTQAPAAGTPTMVIEEPAPPEPPATTPPPTPPTKPARRRRRVLQTEPPAAAPANAPETTEPPAPPVPSLEPRESSVEETALRRQIQGLQDDVRQRIAKLSRAGLSGADRKTLDDARTFFAQSARALNEGDLQRALTLARKASLLVSALER